MPAVHMITLTESLKVIKDFGAGLRRAAERMSAREALHRVTAAPVFARNSSPAQNVAAMDGIALDFRSFTPPARLEPGQWQRISTGQVLPPYWNAVVKAEDVKWEKECVILENAAEFLQNVRPQGEDFTDSRLLFPAFHSLLPQVQHCQAIHHLQLLHAIERQFVLALFAASPGNGRFRHGPARRQ